MGTACKPGKGVEMLFGHQDDLTQTSAGSVTAPDTTQPTNVTDPVPSTGFPTATDIAAPSAPAFDNPLADESVISLTCHRLRRLLTMTYQMT
ncbi:hypothetical protein IPL85_02300 [Candidatus Saccharibacteria bacterium]|nr:MAG: hypothetical protein IPL85_02300 [Candidatus Saccharibacteria bacterium]